METDKADPLHAHRQDFKRYKEAWKKNRDRYLEDVKFQAGDQWFEENKSARERSGQPCLVVDKLSQYIRQVVNDSRQNRPAIKVRPVDSGADIEVADIYQGIIRHIEDRSNADTAYDTALECAVKGGFGFLRILSEYTTENSFQQDLCIKRVRNPLTVLFDPDCQEADGSDAKKVFVYEEIKKAEFEAMYPDADPIDWDDDGSKNSEWVGEDSITIAEIYWIEDEAINVHLLDDGTTSDDEELALAKSEGVETPAIKQTRKLTRKQLWWGKINGKEFIEGPIKQDGSYIPIVPVWGNEEDIEGEVSYRGMIHAAKDAQRLYNYGRSAYAERVALTPKAPYIAAAGQVDNYPEWETANSESHSVLRYDPQDIGGTPVPPPMRQAASDIPAGFAQDMQISEHDIQAAIGMYSASLGAPSNEKSGRAILARQREGDVSTFHYHDNLSRAIRQCGRILVELIPKRYDTKRVARIIGQDGAVEMVQIDPSIKRPMEKRGKQTIYNLGVGTYDVTVSSGPSYTTRRQEAADAMLQLSQGNPQLMGVVGDLMIRNMDWPGAEEIADRLKLLLPPQIQQAEQAEEGDIPPEMQAIMQQAQQAIMEREQALQQAGMQMQELTAQLGQLQQSVDSKTAELQIKAQELAIKEQEIAIKAREAQIKGFDAETDRIEALAKIDAEQKSAAEESAAFSESLQAVGQSLAERMQQSEAIIAQALTNITESIKAPKKKMAKVSRGADGAYEMESIGEDGRITKARAERQPDGTFVMQSEESE